MKRTRFFIVGAPKCGTTAWTEYLSSHHDICFSKMKEPHFFNTDFPGFRWATTWEEYGALFSECTFEKVIGEASVYYLYSEEAARNIAEYSPTAKILIMLRSPGRFIRSYHNQLLLNCDEDIDDLREAWELSGCRAPGRIPKGCRETAFLDYKAIGLFSRQVARFYDYFPANRIKVTFMENWIDSPRKFYLEMLEFLGLEDDGRIDFAQMHAAKNVASRRLHYLTQRPPGFLRDLASLIKCVPGLGEVRISHLIRKLNIQPGYFKAIDHELERGIDDFFKDDQRELRELLKRVG